MVRDALNSSMAVCILVCVVSACFAGGTISGTVEDSGETAISGVKVIVFDDSWLGRFKLDQVADVTETDANGDYSITGLDPDTYTVLFGKDGYALHYEHTKVVTDENTTDVDATLITGGSISGNVQVDSTDTQGVGVHSMKNGWVYGMAATDANGDYSIAKVEAGTYTLLMVYVEPNTRARVYDIIGSVTVTNGQDTSDKDFSVCSDEEIPADPGPPCRGTLYVAAQNGDEDYAANLACALVGPDGHALMCPDALNDGNPDSGPDLKGAIAIFHSVPSGSGFEIKILSSSLGTGNNTVTLTSSASTETVTVE